MLNDSTTNLTNIGSSSTQSLGVGNDETLIFLVYYIGMFVFIMLLNIPGNLLVICTVLRHRNLRQPCNYYIVSLAFTDLIIGFIYPLYNISHLKSVGAISRPLSNWSNCRMVVTLVLSMETCSSYHLVAITVTRYIAIVYPLRYHLLVTNRSTAVTIVIVWLVSQVSGVLLYSIYEPGPIDQCRYEAIFSITHVAILMVIQLCLPLTVMIGLYIKIASIARQQARVMALQFQGTLGNTTGSRRLINTDVKSTVVVSILLGCFCIGWGPMIVYFFYTLLCTDCHVNKYVRASVRILLYMNSAVNVFIYAGRLIDFREHIKNDIKNFFNATKSKLSCMIFMRQSLESHANNSHNIGTKRISHETRANNFA